MSIESVNVLDILSNPVSIVDPTMVGPRETICKVKVLGELENAIWRLVFPNSIS